MQNVLVPLAVASVVGLTQSAAAQGQLSPTKQLIAVKVDEAPAIDGKIEDPAWTVATALTTWDPLAKIEITIKSVYTDGEIFMLVQFPDETENREHKTMVWDGAAGIYKTGPKREDTFVFKWNMEPYPVDLTVSGEDSYAADTWYWKSNRTDHAGYADDKIQVYGNERVAESTEVIGKSGRPFFLHRSGDEGRAAYTVLIHDKYVADTIPKYAYRDPQRSRADIRAKGRWQNMTWTIEFGRKLDTGHHDDVQFLPTQGYQFGVSRYEIAARRVDPAIEEPLFGAGEISEPLELVFR
jgi:hypothetical protein